VVFLVIISIYLSYFDTPTLSYLVEPAWFIDQKELHTKYASLLNYKVIPPLITDLEGDGVNEVVLITTDFKLKVFSADIPAGESEEVYHPEEVYTTNLLVHGDTPDSTGHVPVALKAGYVEPYSDVEARSQVVVVVFEDWTVHCYDSSLHLMWEKAVAHKTFDIEHLIKDFRIHDASVYIAPLQLKDDASSGVVLVGARMTRRHTTFEVGEEVDATIENVSNADEDAESRNEANAAAKLSHFSVFALDASSGHVEWKHDGLELRTEQYSRSLPQHAYSLDLKDLMTKSHHASGISDWMVFRQSLVDELPHTWYGIEHTSMRIAHFIRRHIGASAGQQIRKGRATAGAFGAAGGTHSGTSGTSGGGGTAGQRHAHKVLGGSGGPNSRGTHRDTHAGRGRNGKPATSLHKLPLLAGEVEKHSLDKAASLPHHAAEHTENPNVLVVHTQHGIEVVALRTGVPITSLALSPGRVYADVDGDGVVDTITVLDNPEGARHHQSEFAHHQHDGQQQLRHCLVIAMSGLPARSQLFNGTVCPDRPSLRDAPLGQEAPSHSAERGPSHPHISHTPPLVLRKLNPDTMKESKERDVVVAIHSGVVTSYSGSGEFNWQIRTAPQWSAIMDNSEAGNSTSGSGTSTATSKLTSDAASVLAFDSDANRVSELGTHNSIYSSILVSGESSLLLLSREGDSLTTADIPRAPIAPPVLGDFDNDGVTDIILVTDGAVLGYHLHVQQASRGILIALVVLVAIAAVIFVANIQQSPISLLDGSSGIPDAKSSSSTGAVHHHHRQQEQPATLRPTRAKPQKSRFQIIRSTDDQHLD